ncbi:hypothetical protein [Variovorax gossypii]
MEGEHFDPPADCPHCGAGHGYSEWDWAGDLDEFEDAVLCPSCGGIVEVEDIYPSV